MKDTLKTSKDLEKAVHVGDVMKFLDEENEVGTDWMTSIILAGDLKAEAVKWVNWEILQDNDFSANGYGDTNNVQSFIKHFFNITEEIRNGK